MNKPEVKEYKSTGATCALNKDKKTSQDLIQLHEKKIKLISDQNGGKILGKKVINNCNNQLIPFQIMPTEYEEHCKSVSPVVPYKKDKAKEHRFEDTTEVDWADDGVPPSTPCLMKEISQMMDREEARNLTNKSRSEFAMFDIEAEATESEAEEQEHAYNIGGDRHKVNTANTDEDEDASDTDSISTVEYYKEDRNEQEKPGFEEKPEEIIMISEDDEKDATEEAVKVNKSANKPNAEMGPTSPLQRQNVIKVVGKQRSPPRRRSGSGTSSPPPSARSSPTSSPRLRSSKKKCNTPRNRRSPINKALLVIPSSKRKLLEGFSKRELLEEHAEQNIELLLQLASLREKSKEDDTQKLKLSKALLAKKRYVALKDDVSPEVFLDRAFEATEALKAVASEMSPNSNRELLSATFTPKGVNLRAYSIPKTTVQCSEKLSAALSWHDMNYPSPGHKPTFTIGCANAPKVNILTSTNESNINHNSVLQGLRVETTVSTTHDSSNANPKVNGNPSFSSFSSFQRMDLSQEPMEDLDDSMISPNARIAREAQRAAQEGNGIQGQPGTPDVRQSQQVTPGARQGPLQHEGGVRQSPLQHEGGVRQGPLQLEGGV